MNPSNDNILLSDEQRIALKGWYQERIKISRARKIYDLLEPEFYFQILFFLLIGVFELKNPDSYQFAYITLLFVLSTSFYSVIYTIRYQRERFKECVKFDEVKVKHIYRALKSIKEKMVIEKDIILFFHKSSTSYTYTFESLSRDKIYIMLSRCMLRLSVTNPGYFSAIMTHELSHTLQQDSYLWFIQKVSRFSRIYLSVLLIVFINYFLVIPHDDKSRDFLLCCFIITYLLVKAQIRKFKEKRYNSELHADVAALIFNDNSEAIFEVLTSEIFTDHEDDYHPSCAERLSALQKKCVSIN